MEKTRIEYLKRAESIKTRFEKETGWYLNENIELFIDWIKSNISTWSPATRRLYKASLVYWLKREGIEFDKALWSNVFRSSVSKKQVREIYGKRTSAKKMKSLKKSVSYHVLGALEVSSSKRASLTLKLLEASKVFGLRPYEWAYAKPYLNEKGNFGIKVKNAKKTQGRSFGEYRTIYLNKTEDLYGNEYSDVQKQAVYDAEYVMSHFKTLKDKLCHLTDEKELEREYEHHVQLELRACRLLLRQINARLEKCGAIKQDQRTVLYSARHQFAADAKKAGLDPLEIAALMGHGALDTNEKHYGRKINGNGGFCVSASDEDMTAIMNKQSKADKGISR